MSRIRLQRLESDQSEFDAWMSNGGARYVEVLETIGKPTSTWRLRLHAPGIAGVSGSVESVAGTRRLGPFRIRDHHDLRFMMPDDYPFRPPIVNFLDPILHPNVFPIGRLCWGIAETDPRWWRGGEGLGRLVERLLQLIIGDPSCTNLASPANPEAVPPYHTNAHLFPLAALNFGRSTAPGLRFKEARS